MIIAAAMRRRLRQEFKVIYHGSTYDYILNCVIPKHLRGKNFEEGFITDTNEFVDRKTAARIAYECEQIREKKDELSPEDL